MLAELLGTVLDSFIEADSKVEEEKTIEQAKEEARQAKMSTLTRL